LVGNILLTPSTVKLLAKDFIDDVIVLQQQQQHHLS